MDYDIEKIAKEALLTFFLEVSETYIARINALDLCYISRWLSKIYLEDVYTMRTHLLLLYHQVRQGRLTLPFCIDPDEIKLFQFRPVTLFPDGYPPTRSQLLRLLVRKSTQAGATHESFRESEAPPCPPHRFVIPQRGAASNGRSRSQTRDTIQCRIDNRRCMSTDRVAQANQNTANSQSYAAATNGSACCPQTSTPQKANRPPPCFPLSPVRRRLNNTLS